MPTWKPPGNPVQLISLVPNHAKTDKSRKLKLQTQVFRDIISKAENYPIAIISIAGAARTGRSFILTHLLRYLQALEKSPHGDAGDWMDTENPNKSMKDTGFVFRNSPDRTTEGIWIWSRPFIISRANSPEPIAILVLDTEGCFDAFSSEREQSAIIGLTLLASSTFIWNECTQINENTLLTLSKFMQYTQLVASESFQERSFQRLLFLVRDWNSPESFPYGVAGGQEFLERLFQTDIPNITKAAVQRREQIRSHFEDLDAYLLPHPGEEALYSGFVGSIAEMKDIFRDHLEKLIVKLVEDVSPKKIGKDSLSGRSYYNLVQKSVEAFNSENLPNPAAILPETVLMALEAEASMQVSKYKEAFEQKLPTLDSPFLETEALESIHSELKTKIMQTCRSQLGIALERQPFLQKAEEGMDTCFLQFCEQNRQEQEDFILACETEAVETFQRHIEIDVTAVKEYWEHEEFNAITSAAEEKAEAQFLKAVKPCPEKLWKGQLKFLQEKLSNIKVRCWKELEAARRLTEIKMEEIIEGVVSDVYENLTLIIEDQILTESLLEKLSSRHQAIAIKKFDQAVKREFTEEPFINQFRELLISNLKSKFEVLTKENTGRLDKLLSQVTQKIDAAVETLKEDVKNLVPNTKITDFSAFDSAFKKLYAASVEDLRELMLVDQKLYTEYKNQLKSVLEAVIFEAKESIQRAEEAKKEECKVLVESNIEEFRNRLLSLMQSSEGPFDEQELKQKLNSMRNEIQRLLSTALEKTDPEGATIFLDQFNSLASKEIKKVIEQSSERKKALEKAVTDKILALKKEYRDLIALKEQTCRGIFDLHCAHFNLVTNLIAGLKAEILQNSWKLSAPWEDILRSDLEKIFAEVKSAFEIKLEQRKRVRETVVPDAIASFEEEAKSFIWTNPLVKKPKLEARMDELVGDLSNTVRGQVYAVYDAESKERKEIMMNFEGKIEDFKYNLHFYAKKCKQSCLNAADTFADECVIFAQKKVQDVVNSATSDNLTALKNDLNDVQNFTRATFDGLWVFDNQNELKDSTWNLILLSIEPLVKRAYPRLFTKFQRERKELISLMPESISNSLSFSCAQKKLLSGKFYSQSELEALIALAKEEVESNYKTSTEGINLRNHPDILHRFEGKIEAKAEDLRQRNAENSTAALNGAKAKVEDYARSGKHKIGTKIQLDELMKQAESVGEDYLKQKCAEGLSDHGESLTALKKFTENLRIDLGKEASSNQDVVLAEALKIYTACMSKYFESNQSITRKQLADHHKLALEACIEECEKIFFFNAELKTTIERRLELSLRVWENRISLELGQNQSDIAVGIHLGSSCCVAVCQRGEAEVIKDNSGRSRVPSYVYFAVEDDPVVGVEAKRYCTIFHPGETVFDTLRLIGRAFNDPYVQNNMKSWHFHVRCSKSGRPEIVVNNRPYSPEHISSLLLSHMRKLASKHLGCNVTKAVITVPANFGYKQREATRQATQMAGLDVLQIIDEPVAAAMAYDIGWKRDVVRNILVFDFGGRTLSATILKASGANIRELASVKDDYLGGDDFVDNMVVFCAEQFQEKHRINLMETTDDTNNPIRRARRRGLNRLRTQCENAKHNLTQSPVTNIYIEVLYDYHDLDVTMSRKEFETINDKLFRRAMDTVQQAITKARLEKEDIQEVLMVGGSSRILRIQMLLKDFFGDHKVTVNERVDVQEAVALGASIQACILMGTTVMTT